MRLLSDSIEDFIKALMEDEQDQQQAIELRRNELAEHFQCAPSQINYVLATRCLDVGSSHPGAGAGPKGWAVRPLKWYVSWVQNVVRQFGPYPSRA